MIIAFFSKTSPKQPRTTENQLLYIEAKLSPSVTLRQDIRTYIQRFVRVLFPLLSRDFGVREPNGVQKLSKFAVVTRACYHLRLKCNFAPFFALERYNWVDFQAFSAENPKNSNFLAEFQMPQNYVQIRQIDSKTHFWDSRSPADAFLYLGSAPMTNIGA